MMWSRGVAWGVGRKCAAVTLIAAGCCLVGAWLGASTIAAKPLKVVVLTDAAGLGDKGFNDVCWQGVERAKEAFGLDTQFLQSREQADYVANLTLTAKHADVTVTLGYLFEDAVREVAPLIPDKPFIHVEGDIPSANTASFDFQSEEGGFLAGLVGGLFTKASRIGVVAGMDIPPVEAYVTGFKAGVKTAQQYREKALDIVVAYAGSFNDPVKGKALAQAAIDQGVDVIFRAAGNTGIGVLEAVKGATGVYLIAEDLDQDDALPGRILTSALKRMDVAVFQALEAVVHGRFQGGHRWLGAADGAVDITEMPHTRSLFDKADFDRIQLARQLLKGRKIAVPKRYGDLQEFQPPALNP